MPDEEHLIKERMEQKRVDLADKIETLESTLMETVQNTLHGATDVVNKVEQTVENVTDSVTDSVEAVKEKVEESVEAVKDAFNVSRHVRHHPWAMVGGAVVLGFLGGRLLRRHRTHMPPPRRRGRRGAAAPVTLGPEMGDGIGRPADLDRPAESYEERAEQQPSWVSQLGSTFGDELTKLKGLALGATMGVLRDMVTSAAPEPLRPQLTEVMNSFTTKLGGRTFEGPLLGDDSGHQGGEHHDR